MYYLSTRVDRVYCFSSAETRPASHEPWTSVKGFSDSIWAPSGVCESCFFRSDITHRPKAELQKLPHMVAIELWSKWQTCSVRWRSDSGLFWYLTWTSLPTSRLGLWISLIPSWRCCGHSWGQIFSRRSLWLRFACPAALCASCACWHPQSSVWVCSQCILSSYSCQTRCHGRTGACLDKLYASFPCSSRRFDSIRGSHREVCVLVIPRGHRVSIQIFVCLQWV